jgi:hypothetical protein
MATKALATFAATDLDVIAQEREALKREREERDNRADRLKLVEGKNHIRVMPPRMGEKSPFSRVYVHYLRNPATPTQPGRPVLCPLKNRNAPCAVCKKVGQLRRSNNDVDKRVAADLSAARRIHANAVDLKEPDKGVQVWEFGVMIYSELLSYMDKDDPSAVGDFTHPDTGYNIIVERTGTTKDNTKYQTRVVKAPSAIANRDWLNSLHDLSKVISGIDDDRIAAILEGRDPDAASGGEAPPAGIDNAIDDDLYDPPAKK